MDKLKYLKTEDIKFDEDNVYFAKHTLLYERILENLNDEDAGVYLLLIMSLEVSIEEGYELEDERPVAFFDLEDVCKYSNMPMDKLQKSYNELLKRGYIEEIDINGYLGRVFLY